MSRIDDVSRYNHSHVHDRRCDDRRSDCGPEPRITVDGNVTKTPLYEIKATNDDHGTILVREKGTNDWFKAFGDPHILTSKGLTADFHDGNLTLSGLKDGTEITLVPTEMDANGKSTIARAVITNGNDASEVYFRAGNPTTRAAPGEGRFLDRATPDGLRLSARDGIDEPTIGRHGPEISGNLDERRFGHDFTVGRFGHLDRYSNGPNYRSGPWFGGGDRPHLPTRPGDGPGWPRHAGGPGPHSSVGNLLAKAEYFDQRADNARSRAEKEYWEGKEARVEDRIKERVEDGWRGSAVDNLLAKEEYFDRMGDRARSRVEKAYWERQEKAVEDRIKDIVT